MIWFWRLCVSVELAFSRGLWTKPSLQNQISMSSELNSELVLSYKLQTKLRFHESGIGLFMGIHLATSSCVRIYARKIETLKFGDQWTTEEGTRVVTYQFVSTQKPDPQCEAVAIAGGRYHSRQGRERWLGPCKKELLDLPDYVFSFCVFCAVPSSISVRRIGFSRKACECEHPEYKTEPSQKQHPEYKIVLGMTAGAQKRKNEDEGEINRLSKYFLINLILFGSGFQPCWVTAPAAMRDSRLRCRGACFRLQKARLALAATGLNARRSALTGSSLRANPRSALGLAQSVRSTIVARPCLRADLCQFI